MDGGSLIVEATRSTSRKGHRVSARGRYVRIPIACFALIEGTSPSAITSYRRQLACYVRADRTSQVNLWRLLTFPSAHKMVPFELGQLKTAQTKITTADICSISTHQTQIARMVRRKQYSLRRFDWSNASRFDAHEQSRRARLNHRRRAVYGVGIFSIDVDDGIITAIRTARANACPIRSCAHRHCAVIAYSRATAR